MTLGMVSLGAAADLLDAAYTPFVYPPRRIVMPLIANALDQEQVAVIQDAPRTYRQSTLRFYARDTTEMELVRGYDEDATTVAFVDFAGVSRNVLLKDFAASLAFGDVWDCRVTMLELASEPTPGFVTFTIGAAVMPTGGTFDIALAWTGGSDTITLDFDADYSDLMSAMSAAMGVTLTDYVSPSTVYVNPGDGLLPLLDASLASDDTTGGTDVVITVGFGAGSET